MAVALAARVEKGEEPDDEGDEEEDDEGRDTDNEIENNEKKMASKSEEKRENKDEEENDEENSVQAQPDYDWEDCENMEFSYVKHLPYTQTEQVIRPKCSCPRALTTGEVVPALYRSWDELEARTKHCIQNEPEVATEEEKKRAIDVLKKQPTDPSLRHQPTDPSLMHFIFSVSFQL